MSTRRIRFAPLPDPRALDSDDDGLLIVPPDDNKPCDTDVPPKPTTQQLLSHPPIAHAPTWHKPRSVNLFRPFPFRRSAPSNPSSNPTPPTPRPKQEIFIKLFRTPSKSSDTGWGFNLTRLSSGGSTSVPLSRTQSAPHPKPPSPRRPKNPQARIRMLNGRVYGAPKKRDPHANPFANARDEDPEFVEWGYGGMGSVRGAQHAGITGAENTRWERLQGDPTLAGGTKKGVGGAAEDDDFDGSGMGWVKKRKEARERAKEKEKEPDEVVPPLEHNLTTVTLPSRHSTYRRTSNRGAEDTPSTSAQRPPSSSSEDSLSESESESYDDDDDDDDEQEDQTRKTAVGAGVEKISRHHE